MQLKTINVKNGVNLHYLETDKFKTISLGIYIMRPLLKSEVTKNSLLSMVIRRGCPSFPLSKDLSKHLENLYGAYLETGVRKKSDLQVIHINFSFANEKYLSKQEDIFDNVLKLADDMVFKQTKFNPTYVNQEKENLKTLIMSQINDKRQYSIQKCIEHMCSNEPYGIDKYGYVNDVDKITQAELYSHYKDVILKSPVNIFVCGKVDIDSVTNNLKKMFEGYNAENAQYPAPIIIKEVKEVKNIVDVEQIAQGKLSMGFRTKLDPTDDKIPALIVCNAIFGSGATSKLFNNVREKLSLAYYASSILDTLKGIMTVNSGIEVCNFQKAYDEILIQLSAVKNGDITDEELSAAKLGMINNFKSITDSVLLMDDYYLSRLISNKIININDFTSQLEGITKQQVIDVAQNIELDTVYFLKGSEA